MFVACCSLFDVRCLLFVCLLCVVCLWFACCSLVVVCCVLHVMVC